MNRIAMEMSVNNSFLDVSVTRTGGIYGTQAPPIDQIRVVGVGREKEFFIPWSGRDANSTGSVTIIELIGQRRDQANSGSFNLGPILESRSRVNRSQGRSPG